MPATPLAPCRRILAKLIEARRITRNAPSRHESDRARRAAHVDGYGIVEHIARPGRRDRPAAETAIFIEPVNHRAVAGTDPISRNADDDPDREALFGLC